MATILNIETSTDVCSVALTSEGQVLDHRENYEGQTHATLLSQYVKDMLDYAHSREMKLDAVAKAAVHRALKGLSDTPATIGVNTLQLLTVSAMFNHFIDEERLLYVPMIDARRMEVYTAAYSPALEAVLEPQAMILNEQSFKALFDEGYTLVMMGNGSDKAQELFAQQRVRFIGGIKPVAVDMLALAEKAFREQQFIDVAYSTPLYLKEFQATKPKNPVLNL